MADRPGVRRAGRVDPVGEPPRGPWRGRGQGPDWI